LASPLAINTCQGGCCCTSDAVRWALTFQNILRCSPRAPVFRPGTADRVALVQHFFEHADRSSALCRQRRILAGFGHDLFPLSGSCERHVLVARISPVSRAALGDDVRQDSSLPPASASRANSVSICWNWPALLLLGVAGESRQHPQIHTRKWRFPQSSSPPPAAPSEFSRPGRSPLGEREIAR